MSINNSGTQNKEFAWPGDIIKYIPSGFKLIAQKDSVKFLAAKAALGFTMFVLLSVTLFWLVLKDDGFQNVALSLWS